MPARSRAVICECTQGRAPHPHPRRRHRPDPIHAPETFRAGARAGSPPESRTLKGIRETGQGVEIGALTTLARDRTLGDPEEKLSRSDRGRQNRRLSAAPATWARSAATSASTPAASGTTSRLPGGKSCGFCIKKDGDLCHVAPGGTKCARCRLTACPMLSCTHARRQLRRPGDHDRRRRE